MAIIEERQQAAVENLATKRDIDGLRKEIEELRQDTKRDIDDLRKDTLHDIETLRLETRLEFEKVRSGMKFYFLGICVVTLLVHKGDSLVQLVMNLLK